MDEPLRIPCEGSGCPVRTPWMIAGFCGMCGLLVDCDRDGNAVAHDRNDVLAMLERGDYG